jgi:hypothetical protein
VKRSVDRAALAAVAAVLAGALAASPAAATWSRERVASNAYEYGNPLLAMNERGDAALLYDTDTGLALARARPGRAFGRPREVPGAGDDSNIGVAVDEHGNVLVAWSENDHSEEAPPFSRDEDCCERIKVVLLRPRSTRFSGPKTLSRAGRDAYLQAVAIVDGRIGIGWNEDYEVVARFSRRGLRMRSAVRASGDYVLAAVPLKSGPFVTFLRAQYEPTRSSVFDLGVRSGRRPAVRRLFSRKADLVSSVSVAANARGQEAIVWDEGKHGVFAGARARGGRLRPRRVARRGVYGYPRVSIDRTGAAVAAWGNVHKVFTSARRPGKAFGKGVAFTRYRRGLVIDDVQVAMNAAGRAVVAWRQQSTERRPEYLHAALRTRGGRRLSGRTLGRLTDEGPSTTVGLDRRGVARVAWEHGKRMYAELGRFSR